MIRPRIARSLHPQGSRHPRGFTLLESCVALAIFAAGAMSLYGLLNTNLFALGRADDVARQTLVVRNAIEHLSAINPTETPKGELTLGSAEVAWESTLLEPIRNGQSQLGPLGDFDVGLYDVEFTIAEQGRVLGTWRMRVAGYEKVRGFLLNAFGTD